MHILDSKNFTYHKESKCFSIFASEFVDLAKGYKSAEENFAIRSHKTGKVVVFELADIQVDEYNDELVAYVYAPKDENIGCSVKIWND